MPTESKKARAKELVSGAPLMKTYSALGVLKNAVEQPFPKIALVSPLQYNIIRPHRWNDFKSDTNLNFYPLLPKDERPGDEKGVARSYSCSDDNITVKICTWLDRTNIPYIDGPSSPMSEDEDECVEGNERLGHLRRYLIVIVDDQPPPDAYVSHYSHGQWHYIAGDDEIPQKNFDLISPFMTMMAVPSTTSPVGTSISVGGG